MNFTMEPLSPLYVEDALTLLRTASERARCFISRWKNPIILNAFKGLDARPSRRCRRAN